MEIIEEVSIGIKHLCVCMNINLFSFISFISCSYLSLSTLQHVLIKMQTFIAIDVKIEYVMKMYINNIVNIHLCLLN